MLLHQNERTAIFIDGANVHSATRELGWKVDYGKVLKYFRLQTRVVRAYYYTAILEEEGGFVAIQGLVDWLQYNGYTLVTKAATSFNNGGVGPRRIKGNMDIELAIDMLLTAKHVDHIVLFSGDGDFRRVVEEVQREGVRVTVVSTVETRPPYCADVLRRQADDFADLHALAGAISTDAASEAAGIIPALV